jgi:hypothetical protein
MFLTEAYIQAAYDIMNIAYHGQEHLDKLPHKQLLPGTLLLLFM